jgi:hypothetical protein
LTVPPEAIGRIIAAHGLPGSGPALLAPPPSEPLRADDWEDLREHIRAQRLTGLFARAVADGTFPATAEQAAEAAADQAGAMAVTLLLERDMLRAVRILLDAGVDYRVLKGSSIAHLDYPDPALRTFADTDLLVRSEEFDAAARALTDAGYQRLYPQPRPGFDRRFTKGTTFTNLDGREIDLHRTFVLGPFGLTVNLADLWGDRDRFVLGGMELLALPQEERFLGVCYHAALGDLPPRLVPLRDIAQAHLGGRVDVDRVLELAERWRAQSVLARAVLLAWDSLGLDVSTPLTVFARNHVAPRREQRALAAYLGRRRGSATLLVASLRVIPGPRAKAAYLAALAWPDQSYLTGRHRGRGSRWLGGTRAMFRGGPT